MSALDFALNCAALVLWLNCCSRGWNASRPQGIALASTLRRAEPLRRDRWWAPASLVAILVIRALLYWQIGSGMHWTPRLSFVAIAVPFRSDSAGRMFLFSFLSFCVFMAAFYFCVLLVSVVNRGLPPGHPWQGFVRVLLGPIDRAPIGVKLAAPFVVGALFWIAFGPVLSRVGVQVPVKSWPHRLEEAALIGLAAWVSWKYVIAAVLVLHVVTSYVYLGNAPVWQFITNTAVNLLRPLAILPMRVARFDFAPLVGLAVVFAAAEGLQRYLPHLYSRLPL